MSGMVDYNVLEENLSRQHYCALDFPLGRKTLEEAAESYLAFLTLPDVTKQGLHKVLDERDRGSTIGYVKRTPEHITGDTKEYFHYNDHVRNDARFHPLLPSTDGAVLERFYDAAQNVYDAAVTTLDGVVRSMEQRVPGLYEKMFPRCQLPSFYLRFIKYDVQPMGNSLAAGHYDRGALTLALAESKPGLRIGRSEKNVWVVENHDGKALMMLGKAFEPLVQETNGPPLIPSWHDVIALEPVKEGERLSRWSIVFFADPSEGMEQIRHTDTHKPCY